MFWVDLNITDQPATNKRLFSEQFLIKQERRNLMKLVHVGARTRQDRRRSGQGGFIGSVQSQIDLCCFDFNYPDLASLKLLKSVRLRYPRLPILMLTEYHSESLAIWALRLHIWNLLVKPVSEGDVNEVAESVHYFRHNRKSGATLLDVPTANCLVPEELRIRLSPSAPEALKPALQFIADHIGEKITEKQVAQRCGLGPYTFSKAFKKQMGQTFQDYLQQQRIRESIRLLKHPAASVTDVAFLSGFSDVSYFSKVFKRLTGISPSTFRDNGKHAGSKTPMGNDANLYMANLSDSG